MTGPFWRSSTASAASTAPTPREADRRHRAAQDQDKGPSQHDTRKWETPGSLRRQTNRLREVASRPARVAGKTTKTCLNDERLWAPLSHTATLPHPAHVKEEHLHDHHFPRQRRRQRELDNTTSAPKLDFVSRFPARTLVAKVGSVVGEAGEVRRQAESRQRGRMARRQQDGGRATTQTTTKVNGKRYRKGEKGKPRRSEEKNSQQRKTNGKEPSTIKKTQRHSTKRAR